MEVARVIAAEFVAIPDVGHLERKRPQCMLTRSVQK